MSGIDLPGLGAFDPRNLQDLQQLLSVSSAPPNVAQGPERVVQRPTPASERPLGDSPGFAGYLADSLSKVQQLQDDARQKARGLALGEDVGLHDVMIAANKSEVAFNLLLEVRNKLVDAWEKLSRSVN